ncbi:MAG TPA: hypothetical protein ENH89_14745 [Aurantimonas coralicida]|uniref:Uncharacterized protein n=1 Tax=Aurantimonas coralicida TaxID=182270 RepID=A0A9C9NGA5_9HYPH|nr:hypothetical protein [Aurantimonas coralicida]
MGIFVSLYFSIFAAGPPDDTDNPAHPIIAEQFARLREQLGRRPALREAIIDFSNINGGSWRTACLFGGYSTPSEEIAKLGATISDADRTRLKDAGSSGLRLTEVEENEMVVAYIDENNRAHFIWFEDGIGSGGQHLRRCVSMPGTEIDLLTN